MQQAIVFSVNLRVKNHKFFVRYFVPVSQKGALFDIIDMLSHLNTLRYPMILRLSFKMIRWQGY